MRLCLIFLVSTFGISQTSIVHDTVRAPKRNDQHGEVTMATSLPDWSDARLDGKKRYIETLLVIDPDLHAYYNFNQTLLRKGLDMLMFSVNQFLYQLDIRVVVVDVYTEIRRYNLSLDDFSRWREQNVGQMTPHDVAILLKLRYEGGVAFVNGICGRTAVGISGFFPESPFEFSSVFVHEFAHLLGLSHQSGAECECRDWQRCLRIDGFERDCAVQALVEMLPRHECIQSPPSRLPHSHLPICGNGYIERDEQCDCGPLKHCLNPICDPLTCQYLLPPSTVLTIVVLISVLITILTVHRIRCCCCKSLAHLSRKSSQSDLSPSSSATSVLPTPDTLKRERHFVFPIIDSGKKREVSLDDTFPAPPAVETSEGYVKMYPPMEPTPRTLRKVLPPPPPRRVDQSDEQRSTVDQLVQQINNLKSTVPADARPVKPPPPPPAAQKPGQAVPMVPETHQTTMKPVVIPMVPVPPPTALKPAVHTVPEVKSPPPVSQKPGPAAMVPQPENRTGTLKPTRRAPVPPVRQPSSDEIIYDVPTV